MGNHWSWGESRQSSQYALVWGGVCAAAVLLPGSEAFQKRYLLCDGHCCGVLNDWTYLGKNWLLGQRMLRGHAVSLGHVALAFAGNRTTILWRFLVVLLPSDLSRENTWRGVFYLYDCLWSSSLHFGVVPGGVYNKHRWVAPCAHMGTHILYVRTQYLWSTDGKKKKTGRKT